MFRMPEPLPDTEPTGAELAAIDAEWPQIAAELAELDAQIRALTYGVGVCELDQRRVRRRRRVVLRVPVARVRVVGGGEAA
jgi:hypothetical protein